MIAGDPVRSSARPQARVRVLIVDDSPSIRAQLERVLSRDPGIEVAGTAPDAYAARDLIVEAEPDVITLDIEMPKMDGITFLGKLMRFRPTPVVVVSSLTERGGVLAMQAFDAGAVEVVSKPGPGYSPAEMAQDLIAAVKAGARARNEPRARSGEVAGPAARLAAPVLAMRQVIAIGASTGGTQAIEKLLRVIPKGCPPMVIVQHMPPVFTRSFADRLADTTALDVREAVDGDPLVPGCVLIAPGGRQMTVRSTGGVKRVEIREAPRVNGHCPSVDVLFNSVVESVGRSAVGVLLTGMGSDGAQGLLAMKRAGATTLVQSQEDCVVFGMPKVAIDLGAADEVLSLKQMPARMLAAAARR
jgi:two-component system chemotaxis response regulator CheB